jgi:serine/threonine protein kinase
MPTPTNSTLQAGDVLTGKYRVERVLGRGGMGMVVAARHLQLGELYAIKVMLPEMLEHPEALDRFLREARASARLRGEHVARVHDVGTLESGVPFMVLEYLEGTDLENVFNKCGALGLGEAAAYVNQACAALVEAHGQGIIHRDLKPSNLFLVRRPNGSPCIKVLDFGISKELGDDKITSKLTKTGTIMGSPHYMSPEQMLDSKTADARSDIWSLGVILYELVTGRLPFIAENMTEIIAKVLSTEPPAPSQVCPGLPPEFDALMTRCLDKDKVQRFQSVQELMKALAPFVGEGNAGSAALEKASSNAAKGSPTDVQMTKEWGQATLDAQTRVVVKEPRRLSSRAWVILTALCTTLIGFVGFLAMRPAVNEPANESNVAKAAASSIPAAASSASSSAEASTAPMPSASVAAREPVPSAKTTAPVVQTAAIKAPSTTTPGITPGKTKKVKGFND